MNIASAIKSEISRLARKELKAETEALKKASGKYRSEIAALKREVAELRRQIRQLTIGAVRERKARPEEGGDQPIRVRFNSKGFATHRQRLGLSASDFGKLVGVSGQTIYHWETEKSRPRDGQLTAIAAVRKMGKREALAALER